MASLLYLGLSIKSFCIGLYTICFLASLSTAEKGVLLKNVEVLTLHHGKMTTGRRSSPMNQLQCISGGSAPCSAFSPRVVQCTNKGSDGYDIQWECKSDMDNAFRFGSVEVSCEGYEYPDDPYILHGSCGLKYSLDYTMEGQNHKEHNYYGNEKTESYNTYQTYGKQSHKSSWLADVIVYVAIGLVVYAFYKTCINRDQSQSDNAYSSTNDDYPNDGRGSGGYGWFGGRTNPSAPRPTGYNDNDSCRNRNSGASSNSTGGFWTGAATGGLLGYMFGQGQNWGGRTAYNRPSYGGGFYSSPSYSSGGFRSSSSSGTRTASGFGGTSRR